MMPGVVKYINKSAKWGYIKGYDDEEYYFEFSSLTFLAENLSLGMEVIFDFYLNGQILYALDIKKN